MRSKYQLLLTISSFVFITKSVSEGIPATNSTKSSKMDVNDPVQTRNEIHAYKVTVSIEYYDRHVIKGSQNSYCSSLRRVVLENVDSAGPSVFTHPAFSECRKLIERIEASSLTDSELEVYPNPFSNLPHLKNLMIYSFRISRLTKDFFSGLPELEGLDVRGSIRNIDPDAFTGMPNLKSLELVYITLEESHLESFKSLPNLERLVIREANISNLNAFKGLSKLKYLIVTHNSISKFNITELKENLPSLTFVELTGNPLDPEFEKKLEKDRIFNPSYDIPYY